MTLALVRHWWLLGMRGIIALVFGAVALLWPGIGLGTFVLLFGTYAFVDGIIAVFCAFGAAERLTQSWPVLLEGIVSVTLGVLAWVWPRLSLQVLYVVATWGLITGALELGGAAMLRLDLTSRSLLVLGGASSVLLAAFLMAIPGAVAVDVVRAVGFYAVVFGALVLAASLRLRQRRPRDRQTAVPASTLSGIVG
jgi:uncharacterized membrane protein HdeD (DUF308 family)